MFPCPAKECRFSFTRNDKLLDHIRTGHGDEALFSCPDPDCDVLLTKDYLPLHNHCFVSANSYRGFPMPRCSFRVRVSALDSIQQHLLEKHDTKGRKRSASFLHARGYNYEFADIVCPICPDRHLFAIHDEFKKHLLNTHCGSYEHCSPGKVMHNCVWKYPLQWRSDEVRAYNSVPDELHKYRRTMLSLFPDFSKHPVWEDIKKCHSFRLP